MAATTSDDLDAILDDALDAFDAAQASSAPRARPSPSIVSPVASQPLPQPAPADDPPDEPATAPPSAVPAPIAVEEEAAAAAGLGDDDDAGRALEDALRALGELGLGADAADQSVSDSDMKLVEEFVTSLGESLSGLGVPGAGGEPGAAGAGFPMPNGAGPAAGDARADGADGGADGGAPPRPEVERLVESIVGHLLSEDVLKAPMAQMRAAYAEWLPANEAKLSPSERSRFTRQQYLVSQICDKYAARAPSPEIMELLAQMQETGAPPDEVMRQLSSDSAVDTLLKQLG